jgi:hypothetical protein
MKVCLVANTIGYPEGGGHFWIYLNWALGLRDGGCEIAWLETAGERTPPPQLALQVKTVNHRLAQYGFERSLVVHHPKPGLTGDALTGIPGLDAAVDADLLVNFQYNLSGDIVRCFRRTALIDIDPGLLQIWLRRGELAMAPHDMYFSIGESIEPTRAIAWQCTAPAVSLAVWPRATAPADAPFTTVSHWYADEWVTTDDGSVYRNDKREGFLPFLDLPQLTRTPLELALCGMDDEPDRRELTSRGWRVRASTEVTATPQAYQQFVQRSRGEISCAKPAYVRLGNAWISDRTLCYLASGKPAVVQHTGPSRFLPDRDGLLRFKTPAEAAACLQEAATNYDHHARAARELAEEHFDAAKVARHLLNVALN